jgi:hypothetical protein
VERYLKIPSGTTESILGEKFESNNMFLWEWIENHHLELGLVKQQIIPLPVNRCRKLKIFGAASHNMQKQSPQIGSTLISQ